MKKYWKWAFLALPLALLLPVSCDKEPIEQHDEVIYYYNNNNNNLRFSIDTLQKYASDKKVRNIYITIAPGETFKALTSSTVNVRKIELQLAKRIAPRKVVGRGNFIFTSGECAYVDSLDLVSLGFSVNQQNRPE